MWRLVPCCPRRVGMGLDTTVPEEEVAQGWQPCRRRWHVDGYCVVPRGGGTGLYADCTAQQVDSRV